MKVTSIPLLIAVVLALLLQNPSYGQNLLGTLSSISGQLKTVKTSDGEWKQQIKAKQARPYVVILELSGTDKKGKTLSSTYEFNLADLDVSSIKYEPRRDEMQVKFRTLRGQEFIKVLEGDQVTRYVGDLTLYAENVDNARALTDDLRKAVPEAKSLMESQIKIGTGLNALAEWLKNNVVNVSNGPDNYGQSISYVTGFNGLKTRLAQQTAAKGKTTEGIFDFNLGDIDDQNVKIGVKGKWVFLDLTTKDRVDYIRHSEGGLIQNNENSVKIYFADIENAREGKLVLQKLLPQAAKKKDEVAPAFQSLEDGLKKLQTAVRNVGELPQAILADCQTVLTTKEKAGPVEYRFFWGDLNEKYAKIKSSGNVFVLNLEVKDRLKYIEVWENGVKVNYTSSLEILAEDIETIRYLPSILEKTILACRNTRKIMVPAGGSTAKVDFISGKLTPIMSGKESVSQELKNTGNCAVTFSQTTNDSKKTLQMKYEVSLTEADPASVDLVVSGGQAYVQLFMRNKEKVIKSFKNDAPSDYTNTIRIQVKDILTGMQIREALRQAVEGCKK